MVAAGYAKEDMVNIDESKRGKRHGKFVNESKKPRARYKFVNESTDAPDWDAASPMQRVTLLGAGGFNDDEIVKYKDLQLSDMPADIAKRVLDACQAWVVESAVSKFTQNAPVQTTTVAQPSVVEDKQDIVDQDPIAPSKAPIEQAQQVQKDMIWQTCMTRLWQ
jgi:hypothetical protein